MKISLNEYDKENASRECQTHVVKSISKVTSSFQQVVHRTFQTKSSRAVCLVSNIRCVIFNVKDDQSCDNCKINDGQRQNWSVRVSLNPRFATVRRGLNLLLPPTLGDMPMIFLSPFTWHRHDHYPLRCTSSTCCDDPREKLHCATTMDS